MLTKSIFKVEKLVCNLSVTLDKPKFEARIKQMRKKMLKKGCPTSIIHVAHNQIDCGPGGLSACLLDLLLLIWNPGSQQHCYLSPTFHSLACCQISGVLVATGNSNQWQGKMGGKQWWQSPYGSWNHANESALAVTLTSCCPVAIGGSIQPAGSPAVQMQPAELNELNTFVFENPKN